MSDKELISRGAEVVTGDLILNRKVVGKYRNGQFILTPEGADELENTIEVTATEVGVKPKTKRAKAEVTEPLPQPAESHDDLTGSLDDILNG